MMLRILQIIVPLWAALAIGAGAGLLVPLVQYLVERVLRLDDPTSAVATHGAPALWGLLAVGLLSDGRAGAGWNRIAGKEVSGYLAAAWPSQFQAQATAAIAVILSSFLLSWLLFAAIQGLTRAWQGEYTIRLPRRARTAQPRPRPRLRQREWRGPRIRLVREAAPAPEGSTDIKPSTEPKPSRLRTWLDAARAWGQRTWERTSALFVRKPQEAMGDRKAGPETVDRKAEPETTDREAEVAMGDNEAGSATVDGSAQPATAED